MRVQYLILNLLYTSDAKSKLIAMPIKDIQTVMEQEGDGYCWKTIYNSIRELLKKEFLKEGMKMGNKSTYYISKEGIKWMREVEEEEDDGTEGASENE